jgi:hypothetical protein
MTPDEFAAKMKENFQDDFDVEKASLPLRSAKSWALECMNQIRYRGVKLSASDERIIEDQIQFWIESAFSYELQRRNEIAKSQ